MAHRWGSRPDGDDEVIALDQPSIGIDAGDRSSGRPEALDLNAGEDANALASNLAGEPVHRAPVVGVAPLLLVQHRGDSPGLPVVEDILHVATALGLAFNEDRRITDLLLAVDCGHIRASPGADLHVAHRVVAVGHGVALPTSTLAMSSRMAGWK
jgi:hypothetical protein